MTDYICTSCNYVGKRKKMMRGSRGMEIFLWTVLFFPGPVYSLWRFLTKRYACPQCGERVMVPVRSKVGKSKLEELEGDISPESLAKIPDMWEKDREKYAQEHPDTKVKIKLKAEPIVPVETKELSEEELRIIKAKKEEEGW
jgi:DNA-directed RNA polymerase subunit RPC12/RpoP